VAIESKRVIDIDEFVPKDEIDELYLNSPYYIVPDGEDGAAEAFAVIREAVDTRVAQSMERPMSSPTPDHSRVLIFIKHSELNQVLRTNRYHPPGAPSMPT